MASASEFSFRLLAFCTTRSSFFVYLFGFVFWILCLMSEELSTGIPSSGLCPMFLGYPF
ncbi:hypothetical protein BYT27DRAFT_7182449 [Phlegmacium glaucopus]|nr:hypothetical protein BYT27DRAFT_7182449 [Phlegmacium glaucopus]